MRGIWNQRSWYKDEATYVRFLFISLPFKNGGYFVDIFRSSGRRRGLMCTELVKFDSKVSIGLSIKTENTYNTLNININNIKKSVKRHLI